MKYKYISILLLFTMTSCNSNSERSSEQTGELYEQINYEKGTFGYDLSFLQKYDSSLVVLESEDKNSQIIVSPKYQAKVFTSSAKGLAGRSFGWVNYAAFDEPLNDHMNAYGGEDRLWLGPEGGKYAVFFKPGSKMVFDEWHTPAAIDTEAWIKTGSKDNEVSMEKETQIQNYAGTDFKIKLSRHVSLLSNSEIQSALEVSYGKDVYAVGFDTQNTITNVGKNEWSESSGAPCLWNLDMFAPSENCVIVIPYNKEATGKIATTDYFGEIPPDRITIKDGLLYFKADGKSRGKLGIPPARVLPVAISYDALNGILTVIKFDTDINAKYLNQEWNTTKAPYSGDAMNAYNDGALEDGTQMGPFYELESVSPAAFLKPGEKLSHKHSVYHFVGNKETLDKISKKLVGISLATIENVFKK